MVQANVELNVVLVGPDSREIIALIMIENRTNEGGDVEQVLRVSTPDRRLPDGLESVVYDDEVADALVEYMRQGRLYDFTRDNVDVRGLFFVDESPAPDGCSSYFTLPTRRRAPSFNKCYFKSGVVYQPVPTHDCPYARDISFAEAVVLAQQAHYTTNFEEFDNNVSKLLGYRYVASRRRLGEFVRMFQRMAARI